MSNLVAKKYVKALMIGKSLEDIKSVSQVINNVASAYSFDKFNIIIDSIEVSKDDKISLINSFDENMSDEIKNLIRLLANNKRLDIIPDIADELKQNISKLDNSYDGVIYINKPLDDSEVEKISNQFAKRFDIKLSLTQNICDYDGIKVDIDGLGVDINFSKERLKSQMIEHILKAV